MKTFKWLLLLALAALPLRAAASDERSRHDANGVPSILALDTLNNLRNLRTDTNGNLFVSIFIDTSSFVQKSGDSMTGPLTLNGSTLTVGGNAFSVGGSSFTVSGGSATAAYSMTAGSFSGSGSGITGIPATGISAGSLGASVIASSVAVNAVGNAQISAVAPTKLSAGNIPVGVNSSGLVSKSLAQLAATVPGQVGQQYYCSDCTQDSVATSTQAATASWARASSKTTPVQ